MPVLPELTEAIHYIDNPGDKGEKTRGREHVLETDEDKLTHYSGKRSPLAEGRELD